jgi:hypothetical protein
MPVTLLLVIIKRLLSLRSLSIIKLKRKIVLRRNISRLNKKSIRSGLLILYLRVTSVPLIRIIKFLQ